MTRSKVTERLNSLFPREGFSFVEIDPSYYRPSKDINIRPRRDTYTLYEIKQSSDLFFTDQKSDSILEEKYAMQKQCRQCLHRDRIIQLQRDDLTRLYQQNKKLNHQLRSSILLNRYYEDDIEKLKHHLKKTNSHLFDYQLNFDQLKQKILSDKNKYSKKKDDEQVNQEEEEDDDEVEEETTIDHIKRLRYEIQMYNRIVAAKEKEEEKLNKNKI